MDERRQPGRAKTGGMVLGAAALAAAAVAFSTVGGGPVAAQPAPAAYSCAIASILAPPGTVFATQVTGSASAPASADVGTVAELTDIAVGVQFDPEQIAFILEMTGTASFGPNGSADLGVTTVGADGLATYSGAGGSVTATGNPGDTMDVTLDQVVLVIPVPGGGGDPILTATCTPAGAPVTLASIELTGEAPPSTAPPTTGPATPTTSPSSPTTAPSPSPEGGQTTPPPAPPAVATPGRGEPAFTG